MTAFEHALNSMKEKVGAKMDTDLTAEQLKELAAQVQGDRQGAQGLRLPPGSLSSSCGWPPRPCSELERQARGGLPQRTKASPTTLGTAVNIVTMVFGNMGDDSGTGVAFTRNPSTGEKAVYGEYLINAQGEDVVAGIRTPKRSRVMAKDMPEAYQQFMEICNILEKHYKNMQDVEFTIEHGKLWMLQTRNGKRTAGAAIKIAVDMANEGLITKEEAVLRVSPEQRRLVAAPAVRPGRQEGRGQGRQAAWQGRQRVAGRGRRPGLLRRRHWPKRRPRKGRSSWSARSPSPMTCTA